MEAKIPLAKIYEHDLGIPDSHILGSKNIPFHVLLWRNQRVYYFTFSKPTENSAQRIKDLIARFRTRELYEVPNEPGICFPYGFIADDGKTAYELKNSLRFTRTPNVIFSLLTASANDPWQTRPTSGLYDSDFRPGYDRQKWKKKRAARQPPHRQAPGRLRRLAPRPAPRLRRTGTRLVRPGPYRRHPRSAGSDPGADLPERHRRPHRLHPAPPKKYCPA